MIAAVTTGIVDANVVAVFFADSDAATDDNAANAGAASWACAFCLRCCLSWNNVLNWIELNELLCEMDFCLLKLGATINVTGIAPDIAATDVVNTTATPPPPSLLPRRCVKHRTCLSTNARMANLRHSFPTNRLLVSSELRLALFQ